MWWQITWNNTYYYKVKVALVHVFKMATITYMTIKGVEFYFPESIRRTAQDLPYKIPVHWQQQWNQISAHCCYLLPLNCWELFKVSMSLNRVTHLDQGDKDWIISAKCYASSEMKKKQHRNHTYQLLLKYLALGHVSRQLVFAYPKQKEGLWVSVLWGLQKSCRLWLLHIRLKILQLASSSSAHPCIHQSWYLTLHYITSCWCCELSIFRFTNAHSESGVAGMMSDHFHKLGI